MPGSFVHLHNHTEYSLLDGAVHIKDLIAECSRMGMPAVAITDHGNLFGAIELVMEANSLNKSVAAWNKEHPEGPQKQEVKPIFGCEVYLFPHAHRREKTASRAPQIYAPAFAGGK